MRRGGEVGGVRSGRDIGRVDPRRTDIAGPRSRVRVCVGVWVRRASPIQSRVAGVIGNMLEYLDIFSGSTVRAPVS